MSFLVVSGVSDQHDMSFESFLVFRESRSQVKVDRIFRER